MREKREIRSKIVQLRFRPSELVELKSIAERHNYLSISEMIRFSLKEFLKRNGIDYGN